MPYELSKAAAERAREAFQQVLDAAVPPYEIGQLRLFADEEETYIAREVERKLFEPTLANAGDLERKWVALLREMTDPGFWKRRMAASAFAEDEGDKSVNWLCYKARTLAGKLEDLLPREKFGRDRRENPGRYYFWHPVTSKSDRQTWKWANELRKAAAESSEWEVKWFADMLLGGDGEPGGSPEAVSDFCMIPLCGLQRWNGEVIRMVRLRNIRGEESKILVLDGECFKSPENFRKWCLVNGNFSWRGNQTQMHELQADTNTVNAWRIYSEIDAMGWQPMKRKVDNIETTESVTPGLLHGAWFYGDCAYFEGQILEADRDGVYRVDGEGYFVAERGRESEFSLGKPKLHPGVRLADLLTFKDLEEWTNKPAPKPVAERLKPEGKKKESVGAMFSEAELLRAYFREVNGRFYDTAGGYEAHLALGAVFAYAASPEIFDRHGLFPGLWVHGQMESGKTKFTEWLLALVGFSVSAGKSATKSTTVGIVQESQNYSGLPLWLDEFRNLEVRTETVGVLRDAYNRQNPLKWSADGVQRKIRTAFVVSGESTSSDAATRSRYPHVQISAVKRLRNHLDWFTQQRKNFFVFWRVLMERRAEFVALHTKYLKEWLAHPLTAGVNEREKMVHGIDWAAWQAMNDLLGAFTAEEAGKFDEFLLEHMRHAGKDVTADTNINVFWTHLMSAFNEGDIAPDLFRVESELADYPAGVMWGRKKLFFEPEGVISALAAFLRKRGETLPLRRNDLRDQLSKERYWLPGQHKKRFLSGQSGGITAWGVDLDKHPLGRQEVDEAAWQAALDDRQKALPGGFPTHIGPEFKDGDPRCGPLFAIVEKVEQRQDERRRQEANAQ